MAKGGEGVMREQWAHGIAEDDFILSDDNRFNSMEEACAAGEAEALMGGLDTYFVGRLGWLDFSDLANFPDDIAQLVIDCMADEAYDLYGCDAENEFTSAVSRKDHDALEKAILDTIKTWCGTLEKKGCRLVEDPVEYPVTGFVNDKEGGSESCQTS